MNKPKVFAHRGDSSNAPENTMPAFERAVRSGADGIETDAHLTADGHIVLIHDENTLRTTGFSGEVGQMAFSDLRKLDAGAWLDDGFAGARIPELWELLELLRPTNMAVNIELKNSYRAYSGLEQAVLHEVARHGMAGRVHYSSFNHRSLALVSALGPGTETALLYDAVLHDVGAYCRMVGATAIHPYWRTVDRQVMDDCKAAGIRVRPWTVDDPTVAKALAALGVDALITNCPTELLATLG